MENTIKAEGIDCKFQRVDGYLFPYTDSPVEWLKLENELPAAHDVRPTAVHIEAVRAAVTGQLCTTLAAPLSCRRLLHGSPRQDLAC